MATQHLLMRFNHVESANLYTRADKIGNVCAAEVTVDLVRTLFVSVYINPSTSTNDIECFLLYNLMAYSPKLFTMWPRLKLFVHYNLPIILTGYLNFNLRDHSNYEYFRSFALEELGLTVVTDPSRSTTLGGSCIDIIHVRDFPHDAVQLTSATSHTTVPFCHNPTTTLRSRRHRTTSSTSTTTTFITTTHD
jgi:hypothetical protein